jgi:hypothetical protein
MNVLPGLVNGIFCDSTGVEFFQQALKMHRSAGLSIKVAAGRKLFPAGVAFGRQAAPDAA